MARPSWMPDGASAQEPATQVAGEADGEPELGLDRYDGRDPQDGFEAAGT